MKKYRVILESQMGPRAGALRLEGTKDGAVTGSIVLLGIDNPASGEWIDETSLRLLHHLRTRISDLECVSVFRLDGDAIAGTLQSGRTILRWHGERVNTGKERKQKP